MRLTLSTVLFAVLLLGGCGKLGGAPSPQQQAQLDAVRQSAISHLETKLQRPLTDGEKSCVTTRLEENGSVMILIMSPLDGEVKDLQQRVAATKP